MGFHITALFMSMKVEKWLVQSIHRSHMTYIDPDPNSNKDFSCFLITYRFAGITKLNP